MNLHYRFPLLNGLHARPATALAEFIKTLGVSILLTNLRNGKQADGRSVLALIACDISLDDQCLFTLEANEHVGVNIESQLLEFLTGEFMHCDDAVHASTTSPAALPLPQMLQQASLNAIHATPVSRGFGLGNIMLLSEPVLTLSADAVQRDSKELEQQKWQWSLSELNRDLNDALHHARGDERSIIEAHLALLNDPQLNAQVTTHLNNGHAVLHAVQAAQAHFEETLAQSQNVYLQERVLDIKDICRRLIMTCYGAESYQQPQLTLTEPTICLANQLTPSQFLALDRQHLKGLVLEAAGETSHTVILARSFGVPVLVGAAQVSQQVAQGERAVIDADHGLLIREPSDEVLRFYQLEHDYAEQLQQRQQRFIHQPAHTVDGVALEVAANIASAAECALAVERGAQSIGLFRTEMLFMDRDDAPTEAEQLMEYQQALHSAGERSVIIRTLDIGGDKPVDFLNIPLEENPFLGYRAVRLYPQFLDLFKIQLRAILQAAVEGNCKIMVPMVSTVAEAKWLREVYNDVKAELIEQQLSFNPNVPLGIMLEVPSCGFIIDQLVRYVDFFSIGSNDLTQYLFAADRGNAQVEYLYDSLNPAFLRQLKFLVDAVHSNGSWVGLCGEFAGNVEHAPLLVGLGLDEISLASPHILSVKERISRLEAEPCRTLVAQALACETRDEVSALLHDFHRQQAVGLPILSAETVLVDAACRSKAEVIKTLIDRLYISGRILDRTAAEQAIWQREALSPTMLGFGIAIPHCKSDAIAANSISIMKLKTPVLWNEGDEVLTDTVFMLTVRESDAGNTHMRIFAQLARRIMRDEFRDTIAACESVAALQGYIEEELAL